MSIGKILQIESSSLDDTLSLGKHLGKACKGGEVFVLASDLGGGKTTLTKGLAKGLESSDTVTSPTFTIKNVYHCRDDIYLHHFDFYRLAEAGVVGHELAEVIDDPKSVIVIEWGDIVSDVLPANSVIININRSKKGEDVREISIHTPNGTEYLIEKVKK